PDGPTLFVALARLTGDPDAPPLAELVSVAVREADGGHEVRVSWAAGPDAVFRFTATAGRSAGSSWSVVPR
ncbi:hypothetical protein GT346_31115, partial [Streptomyces sp. SID161]|nr:hypothetical protein [Streptomyces sp. SID161]